MKANHPINHILVRGWQSWSPVLSRVRFHPRNFSPFGGDNQQILDNIETIKPPATGWCSWYGFGTKINAKIILDHADWVAKHKAHIPLEYILIDDGWTTLGDWLNPDQNKFPAGLEYISREINDRGLKSGLWLAPFLVSPYSMVAQNHPEWLIRNKDGSLLDGGKALPFSIPIKFQRFVLDLRLPEVQNYLKQVIKTVVEKWQFDLLKLDFLYSAHFNEYFRSADEPDNLLRNFLLWIRKEYPDVYIMGCGCPLGPASGSVDSMRISEDIALPQLCKIPIVNTLLHTARLNQLETNLRFRADSNKLWSLDPDVFICSPGYGLSHLQIERLLGVIKKANGTIFLGDALTTLSQKLVDRYVRRLFA